ncbi:hypothetical protein DPMN_026931 [Dreissena polymorpha]|uniref:Uncharacterized protein n=1 Tax=Dreissena polymorpha TaxID=45954 RepID=A0A9D4RF22_DREPO|nr:hypothetical protein DPMN_026931 [Dreissena polymorpha]
MCHILIPHSNFTDCAKFGVLKGAAALHEQRNRGVPIQASAPETDATASPTTTTSENSY